MLGEDRQLAKRSVQNLLEGTWLVDISRLVLEPLPAGALDIMLVILLTHVTAFLYVCRLYFGSSY